MPATGAEVLARRRAMNRDVGRRLAEARIQAGLSQADAAAQVGLTQSAIARLESGARQLEFLVGLDLARRYGIDVVELDPRTNDPAPRDTSATP